MAGYAGNGNFYYNIRTQVDPPEELLRATPIGRWVYDAYDAVGEKVAAADHSKHQTAWQVLCFFKDLNKFFLQDCAAMLAVDGAERQHHAMFAQLDVFRMPEWETYCEKMKTTLTNDDCPLDAKLESVLPGMARWNKAHDETMRTALDNIGDLTNKVKEMSEQMETMDSNTMSCFVDLKKNLAEAFAGAAINLSPESFPAPKTFAGPLDELDHHLSEHLAASASQKPAAAKAPQPPASPPTRLFFMKPKHSTVKGLYEEWYGLESYADDLGGIHGRENSLPKSWRKHLNRQQFSRTARIVQVVDAVMAQNSCPYSQATETLEDLFAKSNCSVAKMVTNLQNAGLLPKGKPRGTKRKHGE